jgi:hypothetical protein
MPMRMQLRNSARLGLPVVLGLAFGIAAPRAHAISAPGYLVTEIGLPDFAQGDVVVASGALFVGRSRF